jgi:hypothetical protein
MHQLTHDSRDTIPIKGSCFFEFDNYQVSVNQISVNQVSILHTINNNFLIICSLVQVICGLPLQSIGGGKG